MNNNDRFQYQRGYADGIAYMISQIQKMLNGINPNPFEIQNDRLVEKKNV